MDNELILLYGAEDLERQRSRYIKAREGLTRRFNIADTAEVSFFSAPGRAEIGGNHTDHQRGRVLAAAVNADIICAAVKSVNVELVTEEYGDIIVNPRESGVEDGSASLVRGVIDYFSKNGYATGGIRAYIMTDVQQGSGLSSSAAFCNLLGTALNHFYNGGAIQPLEIAKAGKHAENVFYGKPSGLMDQAASALGGFVYIDFAPEIPVTERIPFKPEEHGLTLCAVDTGGSHADLTGEYAAIPAEMRSVAAILGKDALAYCDANEFYARIPEIRLKTGDRAVLRAHHFFGETERAYKQAEMLKQGNLDGFLRLVNDSGRSSAMYLQNIYTANNPALQAMSIALAAAERVLSGRGACRVHGGGFAGTILAFIPNKLYGAFEAELNNLFGACACRRLAVRQYGAVSLMSLSS